MGYEHEHDHALAQPEESSCYSTHLSDDFNSWIPVSVPPGSGKNGALYAGGYFAEDDGGRYRGALMLGSRQPELNLWNVLSGAVAILSGSSRAASTLEDTGRFHEWPDSPSSHSSAIGGEGEAFIAGEGGIFSEDAVKPWRGGHSPSAPPLGSSADADVKALEGILEAEPPEWLPDSKALACMQCLRPFRAVTCGRHHCRFCGGIFCRWCSTGRCLLPARFRERNPQRVCTACEHRLLPVQRILTARVSNAAQKATFDVTDMTCMRGWLNSPYGPSMEMEIYKATNTIRSYCKIGSLEPEKRIPDAVLSGARGLAILTVVKAGMMVTYKMGTGLVVARQADGSWSAPSAIATCGLGWGCQAGGELTDFIIVLRSYKALKAFAGTVHLSLGAGVSAAVGPIGRVAEADIRASTSGAAACYTYSCSKGAFVGVSLESNVVATRNDANSRFYGNPLITSSKILFGHTPQPRAAKPLYDALTDLFQKMALKRLQ